MDEPRAIQSNLRIFQHCYKMCCKSENLKPLKNLLLKNYGRILDFCVDRIKYIDWAPIFIALSDDLSLQCIAIRCRIPVKTVLENIDSERLARNISKSPVILTKFMMNNLTDAVAQCVSQTTELSLLQLEGLPLYVPYITTIADALRINSSLTHVSLQSCLLGDMGCLKLCQALRCHNKVIILNLSNCEITSQGAVYIAELIKYQKIYRYSENWKQTLRYRSPDLDSMSGLRRVTLSGNPSLGDTGFLQLVETLLDDLWIKGIDVQQCGLTEMSVKHSMRLLEFNTTLHVLDLRHNPQITGKSLAGISVALRRNENTSTDEHQWFTINNSNTFTNKDLKYISTNTANASGNKKILARKETPSIQDQLNMSFKSKHDEIKSNKEIIYTNVLKEQLKEEVAHRKQLEDLNERLLHQVKELKQQQIKYWRINVPSCDEPKAFINSTKIKKSQSSHINPTDCWNNTRKKVSKSACLIHQKENDDSTYSDKGKAASIIVEEDIGDSPKISSHPEHKFILGNDSQMCGDINVNEFRNKICTGADILEQLLARRFQSIQEEKKHNHETNSNSGFTSDSSETLIYSNSGSDITVRRLENKAAFYSSDENLNEAG